MEEHITFWLLLLFGVVCFAVTALIIHRDLKAMDKRRTEPPKSPAIYGGHAASNGVLASGPSSDPYDPSPRQG